MPLSDTLQLETQQAFRELDALQGRLDRISDIRLDVTLDTSTLNADIDRTRTLADQTADAFGRVEDQVVLTTDQYRRAVAAMDQGLDASQAIAVATGRVADEAASAEDAVRRVASAMNLSEDEATELANSMGRTTREASELDNDLRQVARAMGLSEQEAAQFTKEMRQASTQASTLDSRTNDIARGWGRVRGLIVGAVAAFGVRGLVRQFDQAIDSATALGESFNAVNVIFGEGAEVVTAFAETAADSAGLAASQVQQLVVPIGAALRNFGFEAEAAGQASVTLTQRAADLASVFNTDVTEALGAIQAALRGETDPIERFGASISAARVEAFALSEGLAATKSEITDAIKVQARYGLVLQDTAATAGDFERTSEDAANQQRSLAANIEEARAGLGDALLPAFQRILEIAPRFLIDVRAMSESIREMAGSAEDAGGPLITLGDIIAGIPRGFGVLGDLASLPVDLLSAGGRLGAALLGTQGGAEGIDAAIDNLIGTVDGFFDSLQQRAILESFIGDLKAGVDPALAFSNAAAATARNTELTAGGLEALARVSGASDERLRDAALAMLEAGTAAGFTTDELAQLEIFLGSVSEAATFDELEGADRVFARFAGSVEDLGDASEDTTEELDPLGDALDAITGAADDTGASIGFILNNLRLFGPEVRGAVEGLDPAVVRAEAFADALDGLAVATQVDFSAAIDEFELLISTTNEAGDEVPATVEQMLTDLQTQADRFARLEAATTILEALGFDSLAADLRSQGIDAVDAAEGFIEDLEAAAEAEDIFDKGGEIGDDLLTGLQDALEQGTITPELLDLVSEFTSAQVQQSVINQAVELGGLFGQELLNAIDLRTDIRIPVNLIPEIQGSTGGVDPTGGGTGGGGGGGSTNVPGGVQLNQVNNFNGTQVTGTDVARITQATSSVIRSRAE